MDPIKKLAARIVGVEKLAFRAATQPQLAYSSIEDGAIQSMQDGTLRAILGKQYDGTQTVVIVNGPIPPQPSAPICIPALEGARIEWDGTFVDSLVSPMDFSRVEAHASIDPDFTAEFAATLIGTFETPRGGVFFTSLVPGTYTIKLVTRSQSGGRSLVSAGTVVIPETLIGSLPDSSDGEPPAGSPAAVVIGGVGALAVRWDAILNNSTVWYEVHVSDDDIAGETFTPDSGTLQASGLLETSYTVRSQLANETPLVRDGSKRYYARIIAYDVDDAAAPGLGGSDTLQPITSADISANFIYANTVNVEQLVGSTLYADVTLSGKIKTASSGQRTEIGADGWKQFGPDGISLRMDFPNDPSKTSYIDAIVNARGLTVNEGMEIRGNSTLAMGSKTILQSQTVGATSPPSLSIDYGTSPTTWNQWLRPIKNFHINTAEDASTLRSVDEFFGNSQMNRDDNVYAFPMITDSDGAQRAEYVFHSYTAIYVGGQERAVSVGQYGVDGVVSPNGYSYRLTSWDDSTIDGIGGAPVKKAERLDGTFSFHWQWHLGRCFASSGNGRAHWIAQAKRDTTAAWPGGTIQLATFTATDSVITTERTRTIASSFFASGETLLGVSFGSSARMLFHNTDEDIWVIHGSINNYVFTDAATPVRQPSREFPAIPAAGAVTATGDLSSGNFGRFMASSTGDAANIGDGLFYRHTNTTWPTTDSSLWWGAFTWYDPVGTVRETNASLYASITMKRRARLAVTVPDLPDPAAGRGTPRLDDDVSAFRFYLTRQITTPIRTDLILQPEQPANLETSLVVTAPNFTGAGDNSDAPPAVTNFPDQAPATIESNALGTGSLPKILLDGDGFAHFEALDVGGEGAASFTGKAFDQLYYSIRAQSQLFGGGVKTVDGSYNAKWSARFLAMGLGRGPNTTTSGYFQIEMPATSTVIPAYGGATSKTVVSAGIPLAAWDALYYELPYGSGATSVDANFRVVNYTSDFTVPNDWILLALRNADSGGAIEWASGENVDAGYTSDIYNIGGQRIKKFNLANGTGTTNGSGQVSYAHGLGQTPSQILVTKGGIGSFHIPGLVGSFNATNFTVLYVDVSTGAVSASGVSCPIFFLAIAE